MTDSKALVQISEEEFKAQALAIQSQIQSGGNFVSTKGKVFTAPDGTTGDSLNMVILGFSTRHEYYEGAYVEGSPTPPDCFAMGDTPNKMIPHETSIELQADDCNSCPNFQWGSSPGGGKACKTQKILALLTPTDVTGDILFIKVSPTALKRFNTYMAQIAAQHGHPVRYITNMTFYPGVIYPSLVFDVDKENNLWKEMWPRVNEAKTMLAAVPQFTKVEEEEAPPVKKAPPRASKKKVVRKKAAKKRG